MSVFPKLFTHCMGKKKHLSNVGDKINMKVCVIKKSSTTCTWEKLSTEIKKQKRSLNPSLITYLQLALLMLHYEKNTQFQFWVNPKSPKKLLK